MKLECKSILEPLFFCRRWGTSCFLSFLHSPLRSFKFLPGFLFPHIGFLALGILSPCKTLFILCTYMYILVSSSSPATPILISLSKLSVRNSHINCALHTFLTSCRNFRESVSPVQYRMPSAPEHPNAALRQSISAEKANVLNTDR